jgi:TRAP transporter TAXI family solute receptor
MGGEADDVQAFYLIFVTCLLAIGPSSSVLAGNPDWPKSLTLVTSSPGGPFYIYGEALTNILTEKLGIAVNPFPTQGSVHNAKLLDSGGAQLGFIAMGVSWQGWNGTGDWTGGKRFQTARALFPMFDSPLQAVVLRRSGITALAQLDKKRIGVGPKANALEAYIRPILQVLGISAEIRNGAHASMAAELLSGDLDAYVTLQGAPVPAIEEAAAKEPLAFVSPSPEQMEAIRKAMPEFSPSKIAAGTYRFLDRDYITIGMYNFAIGRADLPDDLVYQLVKAVFENQPRLVKAFSTARETIPQNVDKNAFLPFHPGAARYYREIGISIPDSLVPTN